MEGLPERANSLSLPAVATQKPQQVSDAALNCLVIYFKPDPLLLAVLFQTGIVTIVGLDAPEALCGLDKPQPYYLPNRAHLF